MRPLLLSLPFVIVTLCLGAAGRAEADVASAVADHILPGYDRLASASAALRSTAETGCPPDPQALQAAFHDAFDAWLGVSHLRFGPSETEDRAFAIAFWPDPRGATPKSLARLLASEDEPISPPDSFRTVSVAARGLYALEFLLFDPAMSSAGTQARRCAVIRAIAEDVFANASAMQSEWRNVYGDKMINPGNEIYRTNTEAARQLFTALVTGLEFTASARLGWPLGTYDRPRPKRAELRRSGRSLRQVVLALQASRALAAHLSGGDAALDARFGTLVARAEALSDPTLSLVAEPAGRVRVEALQQLIDKLRDDVTAQLGPSLGVTPGFNALDGD